MVAIYSYHLVQLIPIRQRRITADSCCELSDHCSVLLWIVVPVTQVAQLSARISLDRETSTAS